MRLQWLSVGIGLVAAACGRPPTAVPVPQPAPVAEAVSQAAATPATAPGNSASATPGDPTVCVAGWLTRKGSDPMTFWAITDSAGTVWQVSNPQAVDSTAAGRSMSEVQVAAIGRRVPRPPFAGLEVLELRSTPCPEGVAGGG